MKYLVLLAGDESRGRRQSETEVRAEMADHDAFSQAVSDRGTILAGEALGDSTTATTLRHVDGRADGLVVLTDGPYAESAEQVGGYYLVETDDVADLAQVCGRLMATPFHPAIEIRPTLGM